MEVDKTEWKVLQRAFSEWEQQGKLTYRQAADLKKSIQFKKTGSQQIAQYFFFIALSCTVLAFGAIFIDEKFIEQIKRYFDLSNATITILTGCLSIAWFWYINKIKLRISLATFEVYLSLGALSSMIALVYFCKIIGAGNGYTTFLFLSALLLFILSTLFRSKALWIGGLAAFLGWFGAFTAWQSYEYLFLGMNYPVRYAVLGSIILLISYLQLKVEALAYSRRLTYVAGLIIFFTSMWGVSIFGNFNYLEEWNKVRQVHELAYTLLFAASSAVGFFLGIKYKEDTARDFSILFLLLNLYTCYFEFFWDTMNKGLFFLILAITFGLLGKWLNGRKRSQKTQVLQAL